MVFASFGDPILNKNGDIVFLATLRGPGVTAANTKGLFMQNGTRPLRMLSRTGDKTHTGRHDPVVPCVCTFGRCADCLFDRISGGWQRYSTRGGWDRYHALLTRRGH